MPLSQTQFSFFFSYLIFILKLLKRLLYTPITQKKFSRLSYANAQMILKVSLSNSCIFKIKIYWRNQLLLLAREVSFKIVKMATIENIIQMLSTESFMCTIWYLISIFKLIYYAFHYFNFYPVRLLTEAQRNHENTWNYLPKSLHFNQYFQVSKQCFKQKDDSFTAISQ